MLLSLLFVAREVERKREFALMSCLLIFFFDAMYFLNTISTWIGEHWENCSNKEDIDESLLLRLFLDESMRDAFWKICPLEIDTMVCIEVFDRLSKQE